jgi:4-aminobutyrate aminotransferase-like enzyme
MGKPMGNGMPIAAVASRAELLDDFGQRTRYFNTFGGNSVSIAAAAAVLDVIEDEELQTNAAAVGNVLLDGLKALTQTHSTIRNPRGAGLYAAADIVAGGAPSAELAAAVVEGLRTRRILIGATGVGRDVLKIRPPLIFSEQDAGQLLAALDEVLDEVSP